MNSAEIKLKRFRTWLRGYCDGAGARPIDDDARAKHVAEYDFGFEAGLCDRRVAMNKKALELEIVVRTLGPADGGNLDA
jgi:hypothetical protein